MNKRSFPLSTEPQPATHLYLTLSVTFALMSSPWVHPQTANKRVAAPPPAMDGITSPNPTNGIDPLSICSGEGMTLPIGFQLSCRLSLLG
jgi:hypothetical protein